MCGMEVRVSSVWFCFRCKCLERERGARVAAHHILCSVVFVL